MFRLLIVDDEFAIRNGIASYFPWAGLGIEVDAVCSDGLEALGLIQRESFDFILCDIRMPRMDGIAFIEALRARGSEADVVFISAHKDFEYAKRAIDLGVKHYIVKPAGYEELNEVFSRLAKEREARLLSAQVETAAETTAAVQIGTTTEPLRTQGLAERLALLLQGDLRGLCLATASSLLGLSPNYLSSRLRAETGKTFSELLAEARMARALLLLSDRSNRVVDVAALVGYADCKSFIRAFGHRYGKPPSAFRLTPGRVPDA
ncbi:MAG: response regulator [Spirochaetes bacterium]|nr:response regulator [Spirochaetota bacterium]